MAVLRNDAGCRCWKGTTVKKSKGGDNMEMLETLNRLEAERAERENSLTSQDAKELNAMVKRSLAIAKRQVAGQFE